MIETLICGETAATLYQLGELRRSAFVDVTVTSPPYNIGIKYADDVKDDFREDDYRTWSREWMYALLRLTKPQGHFFLNVGAIPKKPTRPFDLLVEALGAGWKLQNTFHWVKSISVPGKNEGEWISRGQFKPINSPRFVNDCHEYVFHFTPNGDSPLDRLAVGVPFQDKTNIERWAGKKDKRCRGNVWLVAGAPGDEDGRWLALLVDAEGSICVNISRPSGKSPQHCPVVTVNNTNLRLLEIANELTGGMGTIRPVTPPAEHALIQGTRPCHVLSFTADAALTLIARMYPWLIVKQRQARLALHIGSRKRDAPPTGRERLSSEEITHRERICDMWKALNAGHDVDVSAVEEPTMVWDRGNFWFCPYKTIRSAALQRPHPATFPVELAEMAIKIAGCPPVVMDPFVGSGSTALAAKMNNSHEHGEFVGIDKSPTYIESTKLLLQS